MKVTLASAEPPNRRDPRPRCRCCGRLIRRPASRALSIGPHCLARMDASERHQLVLAAYRATRDLTVSAFLDAVGIDENTFELDVDDLNEAA